MKCFRDALKTAKYWIVGHKLRAAVLGAVLLVVAPWPVKAQFVDPCCAIMAAGLASISSALQNVIGGGLNQILGVDQNAGIEQSLRVDCALRGAQCLREKLGTLLIIPRAVVAADRVVVGDRPTRGDQRLAGGALYRAPL